MANRDLVAIGASAGGVEALVLLCTKLPAQFPAAILVTQHLPSHANSVLDQLLSRAGPLPTKFADHGDPLRRGQIFLAPPGRHLIADGEVISHRSTRALEDAIRLYLAAHNADPKPFVWSVTAEEILEKVSRGRVALASIPANNETPH